MRPRRATVNACEVNCRSLVPTDYPDAKEIIAASFPQAVEASPGSLEVLEQEPWYDPAHLLVAEVDGRVVSHMGVRTGLLSCSGVGVPAGLVGTVCTAVRFRGQGIGAHLMRASFARMKQDGLAMSYLHTSAERYGFYSRLGYRKAIIENPCLTLHLDGLDPDTDSEWPATVKSRPGTPADAETLNEIYEVLYSRVSGSWSRTVPFWERRLQRQPKLFASAPMTVLVAGRDRPLAYVVVLETLDAGTVSEWACLPGAEDVAAGLLRSTLRDWRDRGVLAAHLAIPSCHPLRPRIETLSPEDRTGRGEIWVRLQDRDLYVQRIRTLLDRRAEAAGFRVELRFREDGHALEFGRGELLRLEIGGSDLCSLIYNGRRLPCLLEEGGLTAHPDHGAALSLLFPDTGAARCAQDVY